MKKFINLVLGLVVAVLFTACSGGADENQTTPVTIEDVPTVEQSSTNNVAEVHIVIKDVTTSSITSQVFGEDGDGAKKVDTYVLDAYKLSEFKKGKNINYVVQKKTKKFDSAKDVTFDYKVTFDSLHPDKQYIIRAVAYTENGMKVTEEKVGTSVQIKTEAEPTIVPTISPSPEPTIKPTTTPLTPNKAPTANAGSDVKVDAGKSVKLDGSKSSDSDGTIVYYTWYDENGEVLSTEKSFNFSSTEVKKHIIRLKVTDDDGAKASDTVVITVTKKAVTNTPPKWTASSYDLGTIKDDSENKTLKDLTKICSDKEKDKISFKITNIIVPSKYDKNDWNDSIYIDINGVLKIKNLVTNDPNYDGKVTITVEASAKGGSAKTKLYFLFEDFQ